MAAGPAISLIVPAYNEALLLPRLLSSVHEAAAHFRLGAEAVEVVVADNASTDATAAIAADFGCRVVHVEKRMIAAARNGGAGVARGRIFAFVDADSVLHPETFNRIVEIMAEASVVGGATGVRFDRSSLGIDTTVALMRPLVRMMNLDSGVVFCLAEDFHAIGAYPEDELIAEDLKFLLRLKAHGRKTGRKFRVLSGVQTLTSARKFDRYGDWHFLRMMPLVALAKLVSQRHFLDIVERYWYRR